jgi:hypothetical protein
MSTSPRCLSSPSELQSCITVTNQTASEHTHAFFQTHIEQAHITGTWSWTYMHDPRWRALFYDYLMRESATSAPLTLNEALEYDTQLATQLPSEGFFPPPHISIRSLALTHTHMRIHDPLPLHQQRQSRLCVPSERYVTARTRTMSGTRIGYYTGWIVTAPPDDTTYIYRLQPNAQGPFCDIQGWDPHCTHPSGIFPLSHINEYIWNDIEANPNNLRGTNTGEIIARKIVAAGDEFTLGMGLYEYDWSTYKRKLLTRALQCVNTLCTLQQHHQYQIYTKALMDNLTTLTSVQFADIQNLNGPLHALLQVIEGQYPPQLNEFFEAKGTLHIRDRSLASYIRQLSSVHAFTRMHTFRQADHPDRRQARFYDWPRLLQAEQPPLLMSARQSARLHNLHYNLQCVYPPYTPVSRNSIISDDIYVYNGHNLLPTHITNLDMVHHYGLPILQYDQPVTIIMPNGTLHYSTSYTQLSFLVGKAVILTYPHTLLTWTALCNQNILIDCNSERLKLSTADGTTLLQLPTETSNHTPFHASDILSLNVDTRMDIPDSHFLWTPVLDTTQTQSLTLKDNIITATEDSCASDDDSVDDIPEIDMITEYATSLPDHPPTHIRMAWCNVNGCDDIQKIERLMTLMRTNKLDFLCLLDTRVVSNSWGNALRVAATQRLGIGSTIEIFTTTQGGPKDTARVGGQILIKSPRISCPIRTFCDPSGCATVAGMDFHIGNTDIRLMSTYWPGSVGTATSEHSLWDKLQVYLHSRNQHITPLEYIQGYITRKTTEHNKTTSSSTIIGGDFNAIRSAAAPGHGVHVPLDAWTHSIGHYHVFDRLDMPPRATYYTGTTPKHEIDHILCLDSPLLQPTQGYVLDDAAWAQETDHRPVVADFRIPGYHEQHAPRWKRRRRRAQIIDIARGNKREVYLFQKAMNKITRPIDTSTMSVEELHRKLERIHTDTYKVAHNICSHPRRKRGNWTPQTVALRCRQAALLAIARVVRGMLYAPHVLAKRVKKVCTQWAQKLTGLSQTKAEANEWGNYLGKGPRYWSDLPPWEINVQLPTALRRVRSQLTGRKVTERRQRFQDTLQRRTEARAAGKHLSELKALLGSTPAGSMLDVLDEGDKRIIDPHEIAHHATCFFQDWHKKKDIHYGFHDTTADHDRLLQDRDYFHQQHAETGIPSHLLDKIWTSLNKPQVELSRQTAMRDELLIMLETPPTYSEFRNALHHSKKQSSAGLSGVTYNLMSLWPDTTAQQVHSLLCAIWRHKSTPTFWKWRWLVPIPKKADNNTLINLRPISLIETSRKLWVGIFIDKIKHFWTKSNILCESQHAYLANKSTEGALLQFRNLMEETEECAADQYLSSWDIKRAFDRVPKNILILSWTRLGVPQDVAAYLVGLDTAGTTVIRNPYTELRYRRRGRATFTRQHKPTPSFQAEVGTGQGDVGSPLNWIAFFDILLCALELDTTDQPLFRANGQLYAARDTGYADDLVSAKSTLAGLQAKADIVSAFAIIFGLDIAVAKLRACKVEWGQEKSIEGTINTLAVHKIGWREEEAEQVHLRSHSTPGISEALKYLGVIFDFANTDHSSHRELTNLLHDKLKLLHTRTCDKELKLEAIIYSLYPKVRYPAKMAGWPLSSYQHIDKIFSVAFRRILQLAPTFPHALLYSPRAEGGIGLPLFSSQAQQDKLAMLNRALHGDCSTRASMIGMLERGLRATYSLPTAAKQQIQLPPTTRSMRDADFIKQASKQSLWTQSVSEWLAIDGRSLYRHGTSAVGTPYESILQHYISKQLPDLPHNIARHLAESGLYTITDLVYLHHTTQTLQWNNDIFRDIPGIRPLLHTPAPQYSSIPLLPGQCWATDNPIYPASEGYVWEYLGQMAHTENANIRLWKVPSHGPHTVRLCSPSRSGGTDTTCPLAMLLTGQTQKITLGGDAVDGRGVYRTVLSRKLHRTPTLSTLSPKPHPLLRTIITNNLQELRDSDIFTDGSCTPHTSLISHILGKPSMNTSGAVILKPTGSIDAIGTAIHVTNGQEAGITTIYGMELAMAAVATTIRSILYESPGPPCHIYCDNKAAVHGAHSCTRKKMRKVAHQRLGILFEQLHRTRRDNISTVHHCYSHPERRKARHLYNAVDVGNMMADQASNPLQHLEHYPGVNRFTHTTKDILNDLLTHGQWYVGDIDGTPLVTPSINAVQQHLHSNYLLRRDAYRQNDTYHPRPTFWAAASTTMAARQFACNTKRSYAQQTRITKIIYDHYMHGENRVKGIEDTEQRKELSMCKFCGDEDSEQHSLLLCPGPTQDDSALEDRRTQAVLDISAHISLLPPGLGRKMAETFRDLITDNSQQPQRLWKGLLTHKQMDALFTQHNVTISTPSSATIISSFKHMQHILACGIIDLRTQLTSYMYPRSTPPKSPLEPTPKQAAVIAARNAQPCITVFFKASTSNETPLTTIARNRLTHKVIRTFTTYARGSRTPRILITPPYIPDAPTNPIIKDSSTSSSRPSIITSTTLLNTELRTTLALLPVHSKTKLLTLYRHTDPLWGYRSPSLGFTSAVEDGGLDGD